ncbi:hypothetical protein WR25_21592 [Diploscapter pachys]|uniref:Uncharacterized protein n=1 Tax=Diploscapter pachys TaxID=2018661 RepID=A0A2A2M5G9_9BILA|nr:hypothetical protein WR25_21592 [Diploscapter pachys]
MTHAQARLGAVDDPAGWRQPKILGPLACAQHHAHLVEHRQGALDAVLQQAAPIGQQGLALVRAEARALPGREHQGDDLHKASRAMPLRVRKISASTARAISAGVLLPRFRPIGA